MKVAVARSKARAKLLVRSTPSRLAANPEYPASENSISAETAPPLRVLWLVGLVIFILEQADSAQAAAMTATRKARSALTLELSRVSRAKG